MTDRADEEPECGGRTGTSWAERLGQGAREKEDTLRLDEKLSVGNWDWKPLGMENKGK